MRILHTESSMGLGGQEYRVLAEAQGMVARGHSVLVAAPRQSQLALLAQKQGLKTEFTTAGKEGWVTLVPTFLRIIHHHQIDLVNTHGSLDSWTASFAARVSSRRPVVIRTRHKSTPISRTWRHRILYRILPHAVMTTSESIRKDMVIGQGLDPSRILAVPTGVDLRQFNETAFHRAGREELGISDEAPVLGTVAFLRDYKGLHLCLDAIRALIEEFPSLVYVIVGEGPEEKNLRAKTQALGLTDHVRFLGFREDIPRLLASIIIIFPWDKVSCTSGGPGGG